ncbi:MAG TPA: ZIP family metal transporter [Terriglobia bacterium]|nr:ZIP family metal transporter [Terriglobia bacterium]
MSALSISLGLGVVAGLANLLGGVIVSARAWSRTFLSYFIALGAGFMLATALTEMVPESLRVAPLRAPLLILAGYFIVHFFEHSWPQHFHFGEETHTDQLMNPRVAYTALGGLVIHTFFDGVAIASGFLISSWLGTVIFGAVLLHNVPEGFTMASIMTVAMKRRSAGLWAAGALGLSRLVGVLVMASAGRLVVYGLALSGGVTLYVAASDLIPEVNKTHGARAALAVALGVALVVLLRLLFLGRLAG